MSIATDLKQRYLRLDPLMRLIAINVAVFVLLRVAVLLGLLLGARADAVVSWVEMPSALGELAHRPWTVVTYMISHYGVLHVLFNMLWLYWLGRIFMEYFSARQLVALYVLGGLGGAVLYAAGYVLLPYFAGQSAVLIGASASILAIVTGVAIVEPEYRINLLFVGSISMKWVAIITVAILLLSTGDMNAGAQLAHVGGLLVGVAFGLGIRRGTDITRPLVRCYAAVADRRRPTGRRKAPHYHYQPNRAEAPAPEATKQQGPTEAEIDAILDKLKRSGYGALTDAEKETLFSASRGGDKKET